MDHYYFHLQGGEAYPDTKGTKLESLDAAKHMAVQYIAEYLCHKPQNFWKNETCEVRVTDGADLTLLVVSMIATLSPAIGVQRSL